MKNIIAYLFVTILLITSCSACSGMNPSNVKSSRLTHTERVELALLSSVIILDKKARDNDDLDAICSGAWVSPNHILTAHHCAVTAALGPKEFAMHVEGAMKGEYDLTDKTLQYALLPDTDAGEDIFDSVVTARTGIVIRADHVRDLALVWVAGAEHSPWLSLTKVEPTVGQRLFAVSHMGGVPYSYSETYVSHPRRNAAMVPGSDALTLVTHINGGLWSGSSGASVLNARGEITGMLIATVHGEPALTLMTHRDEIEEFLLAPDGMIAHDDQ